MAVVWAVVYAGGIVTMVMMMLRIPRKLRGCVNSNGEGLRYI